MAIAADTAATADAGAGVVTREPRALVVWDPSPAEIAAAVDWSRWYLTDEEDEGQEGEQGRIISIFRSILATLASERAWRNVYIGSDQFFGWREDQPLVQVSPDVYLLDEPPPRPLPYRWQTWKPGHRPPRFAVEIVLGHSWRKSYEQNPPKYAQLGAGELVLFDPEAAVGVTQGEGRVPLQVFRRDPDGALVRVYQGPGPARSDELDAWLTVVREGQAATLGVARDAAGHNRVPEERQAREAAERAREAERQAREAAERRIAELEQRLGRLERGS